MADDDNDWMNGGDDEEEEQQHKAKGVPKIKKEDPVVEKTEAQKIIEARQKKTQEEDDERIREIEEQRRVAREKEDEDLRKLKEKQAQRKKEREIEEQQQAEAKQQMEEQRLVEEAARKAVFDEERRKKLEEIERRKAAAAAATNGGRNFTIAKKTEENTIDKFMNISKAKNEMSLNTGELKDLKARTLEERVKPLGLEDLDHEGIKNRAEELWRLIQHLETMKYDLEERSKRQEYDIKALNERQRQTTMKKHLSQGVDPEAAQSRYPPKVQLISKYERRTDRRTFHERKVIFETEPPKVELDKAPAPAKKREDWVKAKKPRGADEEDEEGEQEDGQENEAPQEDGEEEVSIW